MSHRAHPLFELLLRAFPRGFRERYGEGMRDTFTERYAEHHATGRLRLLGFLGRTAVNMIGAGVGERLRPTSAEGGARPRWPDAFAQDIRFAVRTLRKSPGFATVAILTLGLGIGGATALFSVVEAVLLRPLPYDEPDRLVQLWQVNERSESSFSTLNFWDLQERSRSFEALASYAVGASPVSVGGEVSRIDVASVSEGFFDVLEVEPIIGRRIMPEEFATGAPVVVVDEAFWRTELGADPDLGARALRSGDQVYTVVGVMPEGTAFPWSTGAWIPRDPQAGEYRTGHNWRVVGRLVPNVTVEAAGVELSAIAAELKQQYGDDTSMTAVLSVPLHEELVGRVRPMLLILLGGAGFLLLVACANVMSLLLARSAARRTEVAVRQAMGAGRGRLTRQFLTEALVLSLAGGALGLAIAGFGVDALLALEPGQLPRADEVGVHPVVLVFALGVSFLTAGVLGLFTTSGTQDDEVQAALRESGRARSGGARAQRMRKLLTSLQVAMTLVLLVGASLLARSVLRLSAVDPGYRTSGALVIDAYLPNTVGFEPGAVADAAQGVARARDALLVRLGALPGVSVVGVTNAVAMTGRGSNGSFLILERPDEVTDFEAFMRLAQDPARVGSAEYRVASADYFRAMGIPLVRGRLFDQRDEPEAPHAAVISQSLAEAQWPGQDPIGKIIQYGNMDGNLRPFTVVGVVGDTRERGLDAAPRPTFYANALQRSTGLRGGFSLVLVGPDDPASLAPAAQAAVRQVAPDVPVRLRTLDEIFAASLAQRRFSLLLLGAFALVAVTLAVTGIYGVIAYLVAQRSREWAIRIALGARRNDVVRQVLLGGLALILAGVLVGTAVALATTRVLEGLLYGVTATDVPTFVGVASLLTLVSLVASYVPAARATRVDPALAMRDL